MNSRSLKKCVFSSSCNSLFHQDKGVVAIITALLLPIFIGFAALAIDVGLWYSQNRKLQFAADAGAIGGAIAFSKSGQSTLSTYATHDIQLNGCTTANHCKIVAINNPPQSGTNKGNDYGIEVILSQPANIYFSGLFLSALTIETRAVALASSSAPGCLMLLGSGANSNLTISGGATLNATQCNIYVNSPASNAVSASGGATINVQKLSVVGETSISGGATINASQGVTTSASPVSDPFASFQIPSFSPCSSSINASSSSTLTVNPGSYCSLTASGGATVTMNPGIYYIDSGNFNVSGGSKLSGTGVTIIMTSSSGSSFGTVNISGGTTVNLSAPTTGSTAGFVFIGDRKSSGLSENFSGGSSQLFNGIVYFPTNDVTYSGGTSESGGTPCFQLIAYGATFSGGSALGSNCGSGVQSSVLSLVE